MARIATLMRVAAVALALCLAGADAHWARIVAERLVRGVAGLPAIEGRKVSVSAGIAGFPLEGRTPEELLAVAEKALEQARAAGGDRVAAHVAAD